MSGEYYMKGTQVKNRVTNNIRRDKNSPKQGKKNKSKEGRLSMDNC